MTNTISIQIANAPCSWGVLEFDLPGQKIGYAQVLDEIKETGYAGTELGDWGFMPTEPAALRRELAARDLSLLGAFVPVDLSKENAHDGGEQLALKTARLMAGRSQHPFLVLADDNGKTRFGRRMPVASRQSKAFRRSAGEPSAGRQPHRCRSAARPARAFSIITVPATWKHPGKSNNSCRAPIPSWWGFVLTPATSGLERRSAGRFQEVPGADLVRPLQDCSPAMHRQSRALGWNYFESLQHGIFCKLGQGDVDFAAMVAELKKVNYQGWIVVEQDVLPGMGTPKEYARRNREFLRACGL